MKLLTCAHCGAKHNTSDMGYCWKCKKPLPEDEPYDFKKADKMPRLAPRID